LRHIPISTRDLIRLDFTSMKYPSPTLALALALALTFGSAFTTNAAEPQLAPLFNGQDLTHFKAAESAGFWRAENGILIGENDAAKKGNYLWTEKSYQDFVISLRVDMSGSFYTGGKPAYPEVGQAKDAKKLMKPEGEWNTFRIQAKGNTFTCWINGQKASEYTDAKFSGAGPLGFQIHPGVVMKCEYRNIRLAEL
jgi:Domain of Unknown Function (DUF1080)